MNLRSGWLKTALDGVTRVLAGAVLLSLLVAGSAGAQGETRGNISGTVRDNEGIVPGATVKVINGETSVTTTLAIMQTVASRNPCVRSLPSTLCAAVPVEPSNP